MVTAAPVILSEMDDWVALGGGNSGIVGDAAHTYGFHCAASDLPTSDYSRTRDPNGAYGPFIDWSYACAGDFSHANNPVLRAYHVDVLRRLMAGEMPMVCEFIGKPWADQPVLYWARWNGIDTLQQYTGAGHDTWSHISWYRSQVDQRANLWSDQTMPSAEDIAAAVWGYVYRDADWTNPNNFSQGYMTFAINAWLSEPPLNASLVEIEQQIAKLQEAVDKLQPATGGVPPHKHDPGEVMAG